MGAMFQYLDLYISRLGVWGPSHTDRTQRSLLRQKKPTRVLCPPSGAMTRRPRGPMDKASAYGAGDCRLESCRGRYASGVLTHLHMRSPSRHVLTVGPCTITRTAVAPPGTSPCAMLATCLTRDGCIHVLQDARDRDALHHQANS